MNETPETLDPFEAELAAMRPAKPSAELVAAIERRLSDRRAGWGAWYWVGGIAAAAACAVVATLLWHAIQEVPRHRQALVPATPTVAGAGDDRPALASYHRALALSPDELDELLDRHAARALAGGGNAASARVTAGPGAIP